jgi:hypothetical protein
LTRGVSPFLAVSVDCDFLDAIFKRAILVIATRNETHRSKDDEERRGLETVEAAWSIPGQVLPSAGSQKSLSIPAAQAMQLYFLSGVLMMSR